MIEFLKRHKLDERYSVDSAGLIDYHQGELSDPRMRAHAKGRGYNLVHRSRPVKIKDMEEFDHIYCMDENNYKALKKLARNDAQIKKIEFLGSYCSKHDVKIIPDPYYGGPEDFEYVLDLLEDACQELCFLFEKDIRG